MGGLQRALLRRKLESQRINNLSPSKFAATTISFGQDEDELCSLLSKSSLLDKTAVMSDAPFVVGNAKRVVNDGVESRDDDDEAAVYSPPQMLTSAPAPLHDVKLLSDNNPAQVSVTSTPQSVLHGMVIIDELSLDGPLHNQITPTPKKRDVYEGRLFESSPIAQPDEYGKMQGLSFVDLSSDLSLDYSTNDDTPHPTPLPKMKSGSSSPTMFVSSPLTTQPNDSLLQESMSSFIRNEESMSTLERQLFDLSITKEEEEDSMKVLHEDAKIDTRETIQDCSTEKKEEMPYDENKFSMRPPNEIALDNSCKGPLMRATSLLVSEDEEGDDEYDNVLDKSTKLGLTASRPLQPAAIMKNDPQDSLSSPTGVADFQDEPFFKSSVPPPPPRLPPPSPARQACPKTNVSQFFDQAFGSCHPLDTISCRRAQRNSAPVSTKKKKQQQQRPTNLSTVESCSSPSSSPMTQSRHVLRVYSPAEELSMARRTANIAQQRHREKSFKARFD